MQEKYYYIKDAPLEERQELTKALKEVVKPHTLAKYVCFYCLLLTVEPYQVAHCGSILCFTCAAKHVVEGRGGRRKKKGVRAYIQCPCDECRSSDGIYVVSQLWFDRAKIRDLNGLKFRCPFDNNCEDFVVAMKLGLHKKICKLSNSSVSLDHVQQYVICHLYFNILGIFFSVLYSNIKIKDNYLCLPV